MEASGWSRIDPHWGGVERLATRTVHVARARRVAPALALAHLGTGRKVATDTRAGEACRRQDGRRTRVPVRRVADDITHGF